MKWLNKWDKYSCQRSKKDWHDRYKNHIGIVIAVYDKVWDAHANIEIRWLNIDKTSNMAAEEITIVNERS